MATTLTLCAILKTFVNFLIFFLILTLKSHLAFYQIVFLFKKSFLEMGLEKCIFSCLIPLSAYIWTLLACFSPSSTNFDKSLFINFQIQNISGVSFVLFVFGTLSGPQQDFLTGHLFGHWAVKDFYCLHLSYFYANFFIAV